jgi:PEP-CTERM motif
MIVASCDWNSPGADRYTGTTETAIHSYADIPKPIRERLSAKMAARQYDDQVVIKRDSISSTKAGAEYAPQMWDMQFGSRGKICQSVNRTKWTDSAEEGGLVYCHESHCLIVPAVCGNIARVSKRSSEITEPQTPALPVDSFESLSNEPAPQTAQAAPQAPANATFANSSQQASTNGQINSSIYSHTSISQHISTSEVVAAVPEPETYALMLLGLGLVAFMKKRTK